jgi:hypothetical protein
LATADQIAQVIKELPSWRQDLMSWDDNTVGTMIDLNSNVNGQDPVAWTIRIFWVQRVALLSAATDVSESGSSRPFSQSYDHAMAMVKYYDGFIATGNFTIVGRIKRRYKRRPGVYLPMDDYGYGGAYVRTS